MGDNAAVHTEALASLLAMAIDHASEYFDVVLTDAELGVLDEYVKYWDESTRQALASLRTRKERRRGR